MDSEIVGRHALLFDDDAMADFVNSGAALLDWHSLQIDRYDVRHLLCSPPPPRRRNRNFKLALMDDSSLASQLDHERFRDLPSFPDQADVEEHEHQTDSLGYHTVAFSYGYTVDSAEKKNADAGMESSRFLPPFPIPNDLLQSLPPTVKVHQIITRTALFVSKHGGQSEIILRVKQGDNPTFGFLMPGHHLHAYFRFLVEHPELHSESDGKFQDEQKKSAIDHNQSNFADGALTLLGYVYGSGEEEEGEDSVKPEKDVAHVSTYSLHHSDSHTLKKTKSQADAKDEPVSKTTIFSNSEKGLSVKNKSLITGSKSGIAKGKEEKSGFFPDVAVKTKSSSMGMPSKIAPLTLEPPPDLKRLIDELVELIARKREQFETTVIEQDSKLEQFPFLLQSNPYHSYYLKVLQTAQESKVSCKGSICGTNDLPGCRMDKKASALQEMDISSMSTDMSLESDWKKKFKMVIGKSKKETQEAGSKDTRHECGVDAATAAALLQAATRGINDSKLITSSVHVSVCNSEGGHTRDFNFDSLLSSNPGNAVEKSDQNRAYNVSAAAPDTADSKPHLTKEQKLKAERLKRAKMFVSMLKIGELPIKAATSCGSSLKPLESGVSRSADEVNLDCKKREPSLASVDIDEPATGEQPGRIYFGEHNERLSKRKYRLRSGVCEDEYKKHSRRYSTSNHKSIYQRNDENSGNDTAIEMERKHHRRRYWTHSSDESEVEGKSSEEDRDHKHYKVKDRSHDHQHVDECENKSKEDKSQKHTRKKYHRKRHQTHSSSDASEDEGESSQEDREHKHYKVKHRSHDHQHVDKHEDKYKEDKNHIRSKKKHGLQLRKRRSSDHYSLDEDENDDYEREEKRSGRYRSRDKHRDCCGDKEAQCKLKRDTTSGDEHQKRSCLVKQKYDERNELEEGEISSSGIVSGDISSRGIASGDISSRGIASGGLGTSTDLLSFGQRAQSQPSQTTTDVPDDLRAKIRAMLMSTGL